MSPANILQSLALTPASSSRAFPASRLLRPTVAAWHRASSRHATTSFPQGGLPPQGKSLRPSQQRSFRSSAASTNFSPASSSSLASSLLRTRARPTFLERCVAGRPFSTGVPTTPEDATVSTTTATTGHSLNPNNSVSASTVPGTKQSEAYILRYTCGVCDHRESKKISKQSYHKGVVIVQCSSCRKRHLIADNLGWFFDESKNVEDFVLEKGERVVKTFRDDSGNWKLRIMQGQEGKKGQASSVSAEEDGGSAAPGSAATGTDRTLSLTDEDALELSSGNFLEFLVKKDLLHVEGGPPEDTAVSGGSGGEAAAATEQIVVDRATEVLSEIPEPGELLTPVSSGEKGRSEV